MRLARDVVDRLLALDAARFRLVLDLEMRAAKREVLAGASKALHARIDGELPRDVVSAAERAWVNAPIGALDSHDRVSISWLVECETVFAWALGLCELPAHDERVDTDIVEAVVPLPGSPIDDFRKLPLRVKEGELHAAEERYGSILWRLRSVPERGSRLLAPFVRDAMRDMDVPLIDDDLPLRGRATFRYLREDDVWRECHSIVLERLRALRWLTDDCSWDDVDVDT